MKKIITLCAILLAWTMCYAQDSVDNPTSDSVTLDLSQVVTSSGTGHYDGDHLDWFVYGDVASIPFTVTTAGTYSLSFDYATIISNLGITFQVRSEAGSVLWEETMDLPYTTPEEGTNDWSHWKNITATTKTPKLAAGNYVFYINYDVEGTWEGNLNTFTANIKNIVLKTTDGSSAGGDDTGDDEVVILGYNNLVDVTSNPDHGFSGTDFTLKMDRNQEGRQQTCDDWNNGINFKKNGIGTIIIPEGKKIYRLEMQGFSQGDNWDYLAGWGNGTATINGGNFEWVEPLGADVTDNATIQAQAKYPLDPCGFKGGTYSAGNMGGYTFAVIDLTSSPYEGEFNVTFSGNNQADVAFVIYTTKEAADKAEAATSISVPTFRPTVNNDAIYNLAGQRVSKSYKGIVIINGKKYFQK